MECLYFFFGVLLKGAIIFLLQNEKLTDFGHGKTVYFHIGSWKSYPFSTLLSGKKIGFLTKSQENCSGELLGILKTLYWLELTQPVHLANRTASFNYGT